MATTAPSCPISGKIVNENVIRWIAFYVVITSCIALFTQSVYPVLLLALDFGLRGFKQEKYSPFRWLGLQCVKRFGFQFKATDYAPKLFASRVGLVAVLTWTVVALLHFSTAYWIIGSILVLFATLESGFAVCVGCIIYQKFQALGIIKVSA